MSAIGTESQVTMGIQIAIFTLFPIGLYGITIQDPKKNQVLFLYLKTSAAKNRLSYVLYTRVKLQLSRLSNIQTRLGYNSTELLCGPEQGMEFT